jgi:hypothetical protein
MLCAVGCRPDGEEARGAGRENYGGDGDGLQEPDRGGASRRGRGGRSRTGAQPEEGQPTRVELEGAGWCRACRGAAGRCCWLLARARTPVRSPVLDWCCLLLPRSYCCSCARMLLLAALGMPVVILNISSFRLVLSLNWIFVLKTGQFT